MEEYTDYVNECNQNGIVPISFSAFVVVYFDEADDEHNEYINSLNDEYKDEDPEEPKVESEEAEDPTT